MKDLKKNQSQSLSSDSDVANFLDKIKNSPLAKPVDSRARLIFSMDATASRQATWDQAAQLQGEMFVKTRGIGDLDVQLVYYRGMGECRASGWVNNSKSLLKLMQSVHCVAGTTQIERVIRHTVAEAENTPVQAVVFVGDCVEEDEEKLFKLVGKLKILATPMFIFQEGNDHVASRVFARMADISGGAHCRFDQNSAKQLGDLLNAVAAYAAGGRNALLKLANASDRGAKLLLEQIS